MQWFKRSFVQNAADKDLEEVTRLFVKTEKNGQKTCRGELDP